MVALAVLPNEIAARAGVHGHSVLTLKVDTLDNIDFATVGPVGTSHPEGWPDAAGCAGHVLEVKGYQTMGVLLFACDADGVSATARGYIRVVGSNGYDAIVDANEARVLGRALVYVVHVAMGGVIFLLVY